MSKRPTLKRANYTLHIATVAGLSGRPNGLLLRLDYVRLLDEVLDLFETEPAFQHFVLDGEVGPLEDYLSIRPENFERIEQLVDEGKLLIGPWYSQSYGSAEIAIRSLMMGLRTADVFGRPMMVGYMPNVNKLPGYLPQIFKAFGIEVAIVGRVDSNQPAELLWIGDDGTKLVLGQVRQGTVSTSVSIANLRANAAPYSESGHLLFPFDWTMSQPDTTRLGLLRAIPEAKMALHDNVFHSHPAAYAKAIQAYSKTHSLPEIASNSDASDHNFAEGCLTHMLEPLTAWVESLASLDPQGATIQRPQYLLQQLWKQCINGTADFEVQADWYRYAENMLIDIAYNVNTAELKSGTSIAKVVFNPEPRSVEYQSHIIPPFSYATFESDSQSIPEQNHVIVKTGIHQGSLPLFTSLISASETQFQITAAKLPEDPDREGLIVRGCNTSDEDIWVTLIPWRPYATIDVVTMDEELTGGQLAQESNGAVRFKAAPHRIHTFWFHDE